MQPPRHLAGLLALCAVFGLNPSTALGFSMEAAEWPEISAGSARQVPVQPGSQRMGWQQTLLRN